MHEDKTRSDAARMQAIRRGNQRGQKAQPLSSDAAFDEPTALQRSYSGSVAEEAGVSIRIAREALRQTGREDRPQAISMAQKIMRHRTDSAPPRPSARAYSRELERGQGRKKNANRFAVLGTEPEDEVDAGEEVDEDGFVML